LELLTTIHTTPVVYGLHAVCHKLRVNKSQDPVLGLFRATVSDANSWYLCYCQLTV